MNIIRSSLFALSAAFFLGSFAAASDRALADGLAAAGAAQAVKGNMDMAKDFLFKALVNDEDCPDAVYELARVFDKENSSSAADFYQRAVQLYNKEGKTQSATKRAEADKRIKALNPYAPRVASAFEEYAVELERIVKRAPESSVKEAAFTRVQELELPAILSADKMPKFYAPALVEKGKPPGEKKSSPEVEKELKALGWTTVKGEFIKKSTGVYETTEGRLEAFKTNGALEFTIIKGAGEGSVIATVRSDYKAEEDETDRSRFSGFSRRRNRDGIEGFGFTYRPGEYKEYGIDENAGGRGFFPAARGPFEVGTHSVPDLPKNTFLIQIAESNLDLTVNGKRGYKVTSGRIGKTGPFVLDINGTVTLENPRCSGN